MKESETAQLCGQPHGKVLVFWMMKFITMMAVVCLSVHAAGRTHGVRILEAPFTTEACVLVDRPERAAADPACRLRRRCLDPALWLYMRVF